jgi:hypothetical protein
MTLLHIEVSLAWLISKSTHRHAHRRLNEIENKLANITQLSRRINVLGEVRLMTATAEQLVAWVTE